MGEELERVRKLEAWVSEQRKKEGSDLASKIDDLREECNEAAEERDTAEGMLRTRNEVIEQYKKELAACSGAGAQQEGVMEEKAIASMATEEEESEAVVEVETSEERMNMVESQIGWTGPQTVDEMEKSEEVVEKEKTS